MVYLERKRRGAAIMPSLTEIAARLITGQTLEELQALFGTDQQRLNEFNKRYNDMRDIAQEMNDG